jgi:hypothetical protein
MGGGGGCPDAPVPCFPRAVAAAATELWVDFIPIPLFWGSAEFALAAAMCW